MCASGLAPARTMIQFFATKLGDRALAGMRDFVCGTYGCERDMIGAAG